MFEYPKIHSIYKRDDKTHKFIMGSYSLPEFEYLTNNIWEFSEKIDGTNVRVFWNYENKEIKFGGRTDNAKMPLSLLERLQQIFTVDKLIKLYPETSVLFFGEGYGKKIQAMGGKYKPDGVDFILFDIAIGRWWLERNTVNKFAQELGISNASILGEGTLNKAVEMEVIGIKSVFGDFLAEGIVCRPKTELFCRNGRRIITKIKHRDF